MAQFTAANIKALEQAGGVGKLIKLGDKIYTGDEHVDAIRSIIKKYQMSYFQRTIDMAGKNVHEFIIKIKAAEQPIPQQIEHLLLEPHYEAELVY